MKKFLLVGSRAGFPRRTLSSLCTLALLCSFAGAVSAQTTPEKATAKKAASVKKAAPASKPVPAKKAAPVKKAGDAKAQAPQQAAVPRSLPADDGIDDDVDNATAVGVAPPAASPVDEPDADTTEAHAAAVINKTPKPAEAKPGDDESWRVKPSGEPPIQVRRAVDKVSARAIAVATAIAGDDHVAAAKAEPDASVAKPADKAPAESPAQADAAPKRRIIHIHAKSALSRLEDSINFAKIRHIAGQILTGGGDQLVLTPYVDDPRWFQAMKLLKDDQCDEAYKLATDVVGPPEEQKNGEPAIRYALARIQMCTDDHADEGKATLEKLAKAGGTIATLARLRLGLPAGKDCHQTDEGLFLSDRIRRAKKLARAGHVDDALHALDTLAEDQTRAWHRYQIHSAQVDILERAGRLKEAARQMLGIYRVARDWSIGDDVEARLERLEKRAGVKVLSFGERVDRMRDLIARGKYRKAREVSIENAKLRGVGGDEIRGWSFYRRALQAERRRDRDKAAEMFAEAEKLVKDKAIRPRLYFGWARALRRLDRDKEAIALYDRLCKEYPRHHLCDDALFEAGRLSQYLEMHHQAREKFEELVGLFPFSKHVPEALWRGAFSAYLMGDYKAAERPLEQIIAYYGDLKDASELSLGLKAQYWLGTAKLKAGDTDGARKALQATINRGPLTWYGRLAVARMKQAGMTPVVTIPRSMLTSRELDDLSTLRVPRDKRLNVAAAYCRLGLYDDAVDQLKEQAAIYPKPKRVHQFLAAVYLADDQPNYAHWIMKRYIDESGPGYNNLRDWGVAFPTNFMKLSHKYGVKYDVPPFLVQAIIRQESGFNTGIHSYAGAVGLMQLMPGTARYTQRTFSDEGGHLSRSEMVQPETNVKLGTMYIRIETAFADDRIPLALAGYNAGPAPLESWFDRYGDREVDAWVESITYREARGYVRKVFTSYVTYAGLYGDGELPSINLKMPKKLREWGDVPELDKVKEGEPVSMLLR